jgi:hypothetical protein
MCSNPATHLCVAHAARGSYHGTLQHLYHSAWRVVSCCSGGSPATSLSWEVVTSRGPRDQCWRHMAAEERLGRSAAERGHCWSKCKCKCIDSKKCRVRWLWPLHQHVTQDFLFAWVVCFVFSIRKQKQKIFKCIQREFSSWSGKEKNEANK